MSNAALQPCLGLGTMALVVLCFPDAVEAVMESNRFSRPVLAAERSTPAELAAVEEALAHPGAPEGAEEREAWTAAERPASAEQAPTPVAVDARELDLAELADVHGL